MPADKRSGGMMVDKKFAREVNRFGIHILPVEMVGTPMSERFCVASKIKCIIRNRGNMFNKSINSLLLRQRHFAWLAGKQFVPTVFIQIRLPAIPLSKIIFWAFRNINIYISNQIKRILWKT